MSVRAGPLQHNLKEESKVLRWDASVASEYILQRPYDEWGGLQQDPECSQMTIS